MIEQFLEDLSTHRADVSVGIFITLFGFLLLVLQSVAKKYKETIKEKFNAIGNTTFKNILKYSILYITPVLGLVYTIYDNYDKPYNFKTNLSLIIIFASLVVIFLLDFITPIYKMVIKILDKNKQNFDMTDKFNKLFSDEIIKLNNEVEELKKRLK